MKIITLILFLVCLFMSLPTMARKPAVEPIMSISIDNEPVVDDPNFKGYSFDKNTESNRNPQSLKEAGIPLRPENDMTFAYLFIGLMFFLPAFMWFGILRHIPVPMPKETKTEIKNEEELKKAS